MTDGASQSREESKMTPAGRDLVPCHDCGAPTTVTYSVLWRHHGDYVLCSACTQSEQGE